MRGVVFLICMTLSTFSTKALPTTERWNFIRRRRFTTNIFLIGKRAARRGANPRLQKRVLFCGESKAVASLYALGYKPEAKAEKLLTEGGAKGFSTFISSYIANALADMGRGGQALSDMKEFYDGMLSRGATTFWESFEPDWLINSGRIDALPEKGQKDIHCTFGKYCYNGYRLSLCHGWSCGPVPFLSERVLGVKFTSAGGKTVRFEPDLLGLERAEGAVPTAYGLIEVSHKRVGEKVVTDYSLPDGVTAEKPEKGR